MNQFYKYFAILLLTTLAFSCNSNSKSTNTKSNNPPEFVLTNDYYDFGTVKYGEILSYSFKYYNKGQSPLIIKKAEVACGCTTVNYIKQPLETNDSAFIEIIFDTKGWNGVQYKQISIFTNERDIASNIIIKATIE